MSEFQSEPYDMTEEEYTTLEDDTLIKKLNEVLLSTYWKGYNMGMQTAGIFFMSGTIATLIVTVFVKKLNG